MSGSATPDSTVYSAYRMTLRGLRKSGPQRAGARKQRAREIVSERYKLPISQVKSIVRKFDEEIQLVREHDPAYLMELKYRQEADELFAAHGNSPSCPHCGNVPTEAGDVVRVRVNPYEEEVNGEFKPLLSCFRCYLAFRDAI